MNKVDNETIVITLPASVVNAVRRLAPPQQFILEAIEFYLQHKQLGPTQLPSEGTGLCGIWDDPRPAEEIIEEIVSARTPGREIVL